MPKLIALLDGEYTVCLKELMITIEILYNKSYHGGDSPVVKIFHSDVFASMDKF